MGPQVGCLWGQRMWRGSSLCLYFTLALWKLAIFSKLYLAAFFGMESKGLISSASLPLFLHVRTTSGGEKNPLDSTTISPWGHEVLCGLC